MLLDWISLFFSHFISPSSLLAYAVAILVLLSLLLDFLVRLDWDLFGVLLPCKIPLFAFMKANNVLAAHPPPSV
jgi:hypothetical protein